MEDHIGLTLHQPLGLARRRETRCHQLDPTNVACRLLRAYDVGQRQPLDGGTCKVSISDQPGSQLTTDHAGRAQDQDVHNTSLHTGGVASSTSTDARPVARGYDCSNSLEGALPTPAF